MRWLRVLLGLTIGASAVLLLLLGGGILWLTAGDLLTDVRNASALAAAGLQAAALLCVMILAACRAEGRWGWVVFLAIEALATAFSVAFGVNWSAPGAELPMALLPLGCALALTGLCAWLRALIHDKIETEESTNEQKA